MQIRLAENIRALRRQHRFTQEQLAESLGVTPGAVYKWEAGLSQPELHFTEDGSGRMTGVTISFRAEGDTFFVVPTKIGRAHV